MGLGIINGHQIYTLFTRHVSTQEADDAKSFMETNTLSAVVHVLNATIDKHQMKIQSEHSKVQQIIELLESETIDWVGIEAAPEDLQRTSLATLVSVYRNDRNSLNNFNIHPQWDQNKTDKILHLLFPSIVIAYAQNSAIFQGVRIVPLENHEQRAEGFEIESRINAQKNILADFLHTRLITLSQFQTIEAFFLDRLYNIIKSNSNSEIESILESLQEEARVAVNTYLDQINEFVHLKEKRSQTAAISISQQSGNGLVIMGPSHAKDIEEYLTASCQTISPIDEDSRTAIKIE